MGMVKGRRYWNNQITTPNWLEVGMIVVKVYSQLKTENNSIVMKITELGLKGEYVDDLYFKGVSSKGHTYSNFYSDSNLAPYQSGWNQSNYLRWPTDEEAKEFERC